jgi:exonuclease III
MEDSQFYGKKNIDHLVRTLPDGSEKIQCIELEGAKRSVIIILCVYMPANGSKNQVEYQECIDELHEIYLKYDHTHDIIIGGDINEDLNKHKPNNTRKAYLINFINEFGCNTKM